MGKSACLFCVHRPAEVPPGVAVGTSRSVSALEQRCALWLFHAPPCTLTCINLVRSRWHERDARRLTIHLLCMLVQGMNEMCTHFAVIPFVIVWCAAGGGPARMSQPQPITEAMPVLGLCKPSCS